MAKLEIVQKLETRIQQLEENLERKKKELEIEIFLKNTYLSFLVEQNITSDYDLYFKEKELQKFKNLQIEHLK
ncbi:hypothetical protein MHJ94_10725 [Chryseobacterium taklimakanense]|uniref:hypothetical protein n=1 Tax=Chryseobacterium taklimakanense TaxID=536441 RepID=UPI001EF6B642|nr:hypothetical protein [Chryseobacterium taklimakanense]MCG7281764.1 hypothetical protein [Chryseobacterium taklimakanense]